MTLSNNMYKILCVRALILRTFNKHVQGLMSQRLTVLNSQQHKSKEYFQRQHIEKMKKSK